MNELEIAVKGTNEALDTYLELTDTETIRAHILEIKNKSETLTRVKEDLIRLIQEF